MEQGRFSIVPDALYRQLVGAAAPLVIDVRRTPAFDAGEFMVPGAVRRAPEEAGHWQKEIARDRPVVVYCARGEEVSREAAATLRRLGGDARFLEGGIAGWTEAGLPLRRKTAATPRQWVTRERPKIDRIACPWLIRRFIDPEASFLYVPTERVFAVAAETGATAYDIPGAEPFSHVGEKCSFDAFLAVYGINDRPLDRLAVIVRGADTARPELAPQAAGLLAISLGLSALHADDQAMLADGMVVYDALYAWCRDCPDETHDWVPGRRP